MRFRTYGQAVLPLPERHSRRLLAVRPPGKAAAPSAQARARLLGPLPAPWRQTGTFDNGAEFAHQHELPARGRGDRLLRHARPLAERGGGKCDRAAAARPAP